MSIFRKVELGIAALLVAVIIALTGYSLYQKGRAEHAREENAVLSGDSAAHETYNEGIRTIIKERKADEERTEEVLAGNSEWSSEPVPDDVAGILRHPTGASEAVP